MTACSHILVLMQRFEYALKQSGRRQTTKSYEKWNFTENILLKISGQKMVYKWSFARDAIAVHQYTLISKVLLSLLPVRWCHYFNWCFLESGAKPSAIQIAGSCLWIILTAALHRIGNKWLVIYRTLRGKYIFFFISMFSSEYWVTTYCFLFSYLRCIRSMLKYLLLIELNQSLRLLHAEMWWGSFGTFHGFLSF